MKYVFIDEKGGIEGRTLQKGNHIDKVLAHFKMKLSKEYSVRPASIYIIDTVEIH